MAVAYLTHPIFAFAHLEDFELLTTGALSHLPLDFIVNPLGVSERTPLLPIGSQGSHELSPVNHTISVVKFVSHGIHFKLRRWELGLQDSIDEFVSWTVAITVVIQLAEEVLDARLFVVVVLEVTLSPVLPVEVLDLFKLLKVVKLVLQPPVALPCHHPDMPPFVPKGLGPRVLDAPFTLAHAGPAGEEECQRGRGPGKTMEGLTSVIACDAHLPFLLSAGNRGPPRRSGVARSPGLARLKKKCWNESRGWGLVT